MYRTKEELAWNIHISLMRPHLVTALASDQTPKPEMSGGKVFEHVRELSHDPSLVLIAQQSSFMYSEPNDSFLTHSS